MGFKPRSLGNTDLEVSAAGVGGGYVLRARDVIWAFDHGINYFFWAPWVPTYRSMERGLKKLLPGHRDKMVIASATYSWLQPGSLERTVSKHLRRLGIERIDVFHLGWVMRASQQRAVEELISLKEKGLIRTLAFSAHKREMILQMSRKWAFDVLMVRYNAAHPGAEEDIFAKLPTSERPGIVAFNALKHGDMMKRPREWPKDRPVPTARQAYRFVLSHPCVDLCLAGPRRRTHMDDLVKVMEEGPLSAEEMDFMKAFGRARHG